MVSQISIWSDRDQHRFIFLVYDCNLRRAVGRVTITCECPITAERLATVWRLLAGTNLNSATPQAEGAGCPVLVVPNDIAVPMGPRRRHVHSLARVHVADLRRVHAELTQFGERTA
jgi:hypothetical protein